MITFESAKSNQDYLNLIRKITYSFGIYEKDVVEQLGVIAIWKAVKSYDETVCDNFVCRLWNSIVWECYRENKERKQNVRCRQINFEVFCENEYADLYDTIDTLSDEERKIINYRFYDKMSIKEIAKATGCGHAKVSQDLKRVIGKLKRRLMAA